MKYKHYYAEYETYKGQKLHRQVTRKPAENGLRGRVKV